jgi:hypothetical protein
LVAFSIEREVCDVLFLKNIKKIHNMPSFMLDLRFKNLYIISSFIGCEKGVDIVKEHDR